jgi:uncharacterized protein YneF (UPF0154 family)
MTLVEALLILVGFVCGVIAGWKVAMRRVNLQIDEMQQDKSNPTT